MCGCNLPSRFIEYLINNPSIHLIFQSLQMWWNKVKVSRLYTPVKYLFSYLIPISQSAFLLFFMQPILSRFTPFGGSMLEKVLSPHYDAFSPLFPMKLWGLLQNKPQVFQSSLWEIRAIDRINENITFITCLGKVELEFRKWRKNWSTLVFYIPFLPFSFHLYILICFIYCLSRYPLLSLHTASLRLAQEICSTIANFPQTFFFLIHLYILLHIYT